AMRLAIVLNRPRKRDRSRWLGAADALEMATTAGAAAVQNGNLGRIAPGQLADIVLYDLTQPRWTPCNDPAQQLVFGETGEGVHTVIVDGQVVVENHRVSFVDTQAVVREARNLLD